MSTNEPTTSASPPIGVPSVGARGDEPRISELVGDRLCAKCCFNLAGQTIVRERHYGLLMVRCPECGTPAALQEYPLLGRWANRLGYVLGGAWMLFMLALVLVCGLSVWGMSEMLTDQMSRPYAAHLQKVWAEHAAASGPPNPYSYANTRADEQWWETMDKKQLFTDAGGWKGAIGWNGLWLGVNVLLLVGSLGAVLAVATPHVRWRGRLALIAIVGGLGGLFWWMAESGSGYGYNSGWNAWKDLWWVLGPVCVGIGMACLTIGLWAGRPLARGMAMLLLPARLRGPLAYLWQADGREMPK